MLNYVIIKSYSGSKAHKSIKYNAWDSTPNGNKKLDAAYQEAKKKSNESHVFLLFSESLISSEEGIKSEIFSLYSRFDEKNPTMVPNISCADNCTNSSRSAEFIEDINLMENLNVEVDAFEGLQAGKQSSEQQCENENPLNNLVCQCTSDSNATENLEIFQGAKSLSPEILHDSSFSELL